MEINAIITGTTGMVGKAVLIESLNHPSVKLILVINRKSIGLKHPKLKEIIHADFFDLSPIKQELKGYNACFFCLQPVVIIKEVTRNAIPTIFNNLSILTSSFVLLLPRPCR